MSEDRKRKEIRCPAEDESTNNREGHRGTFAGRKRFDQSAEKSTAEVNAEET